MSNLEKLAAAGLCDPDRVSDEHKNVINNDLTDEEVEALISSHQKLGSDGSMHDDGPRPSFY